MQNDMTELVAQVVQMVIVPLLMWALVIVRNYLMSRIENEKAQSILMLADEAVRAGVGEVGQTFVDAIKNDGHALTAEQAQSAARMAFTRAVQILGTSGVDVLQKATGDINAYLMAKIEAEVRQTRLPAAIIEYNTAADDLDYAEADEISEVEAIKESEL